MSEEESRSTQAKQAAAKRAKEFWIQHGQYDVVYLTEEQKPKETE